MARRDSRIIITGSIKFVNTINLIHDNYKRKVNKLKEYEKMLEETIVREQAPQETEPKNTSQLLFSHEFEKRKPLTSKQITERIEMLRDEIEDQTSSYQYQFYYVKVKGRYEQLLDVVNHFKLKYYKERMFSRCTACNGIMDRISAEEKHIIKNEVDESTYNENSMFNII